MSQSSLDHLQHSCRKEVKMEEDKDEHCLCKQTGGLISFLVIKASSCSLPEVKWEHFICVTGPAEQRSLLVHHQDSTQHVHLVQLPQAWFMVGQEWEDPGGSWEFGAGILSRKPCCQEEHTQCCLQVKAWKCRYIACR